MGGKISKQSSGKLLIVARKRLAALFAEKLRFNLAALPLYLRKSSAFPAFDLFDCGFAAGGTAAK